MRKAELHVHLEGSTRPETFLQLARRHGVRLPADDVEGLRRWFEFTDFHHFIDVYRAITSCLRTVEDYELIVDEFAKEMARQNVVYAEVTFSPATHRWLGIPDVIWSEGLRRGRDRAREQGIQINWVFDIVRNAERDFGSKHSDYTVEIAIDHMSEGVVALGLGGYEPGYPPEMFVSQFRRAQSAGLHSNPHAGELAGPESVWGAIRLLGAERLGHGVRAIDDPSLVRHLAENRIPLEVSPTSNLRLGVYSSFEEHPIRRLYEAGVPITLSSDDPPLFGTTLTDEFALLESVFGFSHEEAEEIRLNAFRFAFEPVSP